MSTKKSRPKRKHHELPKLYLKGFCKDSFLWIYERGRPYSPGKNTHKFNPYIFGVNQIAEKDRYALAKPDGTWDFETYENCLEKIEKKSNNILHKIRSQEPISLNEKEIFTEYILNLFKRTREREKRVSQIINNNQQTHQLKNTVLSFALNGQFETARKYSDVQEYLQSDYVEKLILFESMLCLYPNLHQTLKSMSWTFYVATSDSYFVTSSAPVIFDRSFGLSVSPLLFPISKNVALIATHDKGTDLEYINTSSDETLMINFYTIIEAQCAYSPKPESWVWDILNHGLDITENQSLALRKLFPFHASG